MSLSKSDLNYYHVSAEFPEGTYSKDVRAVNPMEAANEILLLLGFDQTPSDSFSFSVKPIQAGS